MAPLSIIQTKNYKNFFQKAKQESLKVKTICNIQWLFWKISITLQNMKYPWSTFFQTIASIFPEIKEEKKRIFIVFIRVGCSIWTEWISRIDIHYFTTLFICWLQEQKGTRKKTSEEQSFFFSSSFLWKIMKTLLKNINIICDKE